MKEVTKLATLFLSMAMLLISATACSVLSNNPNGGQTNNGGSTVTEEQKFTVNYYDDKTMEYTLKKGEKSVQTNYIAPAGKIIKGLFDKNDVQYADYNCLVELAGVTVIPSVLYAKYEDVDISYLDEDPFSAYDEDPQQISFYSSTTLSWEFDVTEYPEDQKMISACLCNPYADLVITVSFQGKGLGSDHSNTFTSKLSVCNEIVGSLEQKDLGSDTEYSSYKYTAIIKAKQLTNGEYKITLKTGAKLGYADYTIKNYKIEFDFLFESDNSNETENA